MHKQARALAERRAPCSELSDKAASASAAAMLLVGSGLSSAGRGSRGASAFSVCSAPGGGTRGWIGPFVQGPARSLLQLEQTP
jgi:hypothetical protein